MAVRPILLWPDARLSEVCASLDLRQAEPLVADLFDTMYAAKGRGLAACQIGVMARAFVVDIAWKESQPDPRAFLNPVLLHSTEERTIRDEQCLSIPDLPMPVERPVSVELSWQSADGQTISGTFEGDLARCIFHELDHLNGRVILDHQTPQDRSQLEARYAQ